MIAVLQDRGHVITSHGYSSGSRSQSAASVLQGDAAILRDGVGGVFTASQQPQGELSSWQWSTAVARSDAYT